MKYCVECGCSRVHEPELWLNADGVCPICEDHWKLCAEEAADWLAHKEGSPREPGRIPGPVTVIVFG